MRLRLECVACSGRLEEYERPAGLCARCGGNILARVAVQDSLAKATNAGLSMIFGAMHKPPREDA